MENSTESKATPELTLTLTPELDDAPAPVLSAKPVEELAKSEGDLALDDSMLSDDEKKMVEEFSEQINVRDSAAIMQYGAGAQKKMADFSESALEQVRTNDLGEVGDLITGVVNELRGFNATEEKGLFGFFKRGVDKVQSLRTRYDKAEANVNKIVDQLKDHQMTLVKDADDKHCTFHAHIEDAVIFADQVPILGMYRDQRIQRFAATGMMFQRGYALFE